MSEERRIITTPAHLIRTEAQRWFWTDRIPTATLAIFAGRGGEGKSSYAFHVASEVTTGSLAGDYANAPAPVLIWSGEDRWESVIIPRLKAAGANLELVYKLGVESTVDATSLEVTPNLPGDLELVRAAILETGARLVIFDPISSTMGGDLNKEADTRRTLDGLARIAHATDAVILCIRHFNKGQGNASDKMSGSHAFRDAARAVFLFASDEESGQRIVTQDKGNYSEHGTGSLAFALESVDVATDDGSTAKVARVVPLGASDVSVSDIINRAPDTNDSDRSEAERWLVSYLEDQGGQAAARDIRKAATSDGIEWRTVQRASQKVTDKAKSGFQGAWLWTLNVAKDATKMPKATISENTGTFGTFDPDRGTFDAATPPTSQEETVMNTVTDDPGFCIGCGWTLPCDRTHTALEEARLTSEGKAA